MRWIKTSRRKVEDVKDSEEWKDQRAEEFADSETTQVHGAASRASYIAGGADRLIWRVGAECSSCSYCRLLDGKTIGTDEPFIRSGEEVTPPGLPVLVVKHNISHAPLHEHCDCIVEAVRK